MPESDSRLALFETVQGHTPYLGVEAEGARFVVATRDKQMGRHLFTKQGRPEFRVLRRAVTVVEELAGKEAIADRQFVDVGSNLGTEAIMALTNHGFASAVCFEPEEENHRLLRVNLALNDLTDRAQALRVAVSARPGRAELMVMGGPAGKVELALDREAVERKEARRAARRRENPSDTLPGSAGSTRKRRG